MSMDVPLYDVKQLFNVPPQDLVNLGRQIEAEVQQFNGAFQQLKQSYEALLASQSSLEPLKKEEKGTSLLVPLTSSLYVHGEINSPNVLVDVGGGYFVEKDLKGAQDILKRKADFVKVSLDQVAVRISYQNENVRNINFVLQEQMKAQQKQVQQPQK